MENAQSDEINFLCAGLDIKFQKSITYSLDFSKHIKTPKNYLFHENELQS